METQHFISTNRIIIQFTITFIYLKLLQKLEFNGNIKNKNTIL